MKLKIRYENEFQTIELDAKATEENQSWYQIYQIVRENASVEYKGATPQDDVMERLLRARK